MTVRYAISHVTEYHYSVPVAVSHNEARVRLRPLPYQKILEEDVAIEPAANRRARFRDYHGNSVDYFELREPVEVLRVVASFVVERSAPPAAPANSPPWDAPTPASRAQEFALDSPLIRRSDAFREYAAPSFPAGRPVVAAIKDLTHRIHEDFRFDPTATEVHTAVEEVLKSRAGVCQDFAHLEIACLRSMGLPARYVSGYLRTLPPPGGVRLVGADATHAWVAVHCGEAGWLDFDPTNDLMPGEGHVTVGWGRDYGEVPPLRGVLVGGGDTSLRVAVDVAELATN